MKLPKMDRMMQPDLLQPRSSVRILKTSRVYRSQFVCDGDGHFLNWRDSGKIYSQFRARCTCDGKEFSRHLKTLGGL